MQLLPSRYRPRHRRQRPARRSLAAVAGAALATVYVTMPAEATTADVGQMAEAGLAATSISDVVPSLLDRESRVSRSARPAAIEPVAVIKAKPNRAVSPVARYRLTSEYGDVSGLWSSGSHTGLDFAAPAGTPLRAVKDAVVKRTGWEGAYGQQTVLKLPSGAELWYAHQDSVSVKAGDKVRAGQVIGTVGSTGNVTGPHLHLEFRPKPKRAADPATVLARWDVPRF